MYARSYAKKASGKSQTSFLLKAETPERVSVQGGACALMMAAKQNNQSKENAMNKRLMFLRRVIASTLKEKLKEIGFNSDMVQTFETNDEIVLRRIDGKVVHIVNIDDYSVMDHGFFDYSGDDLAKVAEAFAINKEAIYA